MSGIDRLFWNDDPSEKPEGPQFHRFSEDLVPGLERPIVPYCSHWRQPFKLKNRITVYGSAWLDQPQGRSHPASDTFKGKPDIGLYLDGHWASKQVVVNPGFSLPIKAIKSNKNLILYPWADQGVPENYRVFFELLKCLLEQAASGKTVDIGCMAGHGRTGTTLACLLAFQGLSAKKAVSRVRENYCEEAIESQSQLQLIRAAAR